MDNDTSKPPDCLLAEDFMKLMVALLLILSVERMMLIDPPTCHAELLMKVIFVFLSTTTVE